ncbi:MAG: hypothetical protein F6K26_50510 [Moorea sp. SIO2I5]|nr:hypothetical protein [Moorena sp. SIO2I5]
MQQAITLNPEKYREMAKTDSYFDTIRSDQRFQALINVKSEILGSWESEVGSRESGIGNRESGIGNKNVS